MDSNAPMPGEPREKSIMVVEDDESMRMLIEMILKSDGFDVVPVGSAEECLKAIESKLPDLIVMDFMLPGRGGYETIKDLQGTDAREVPVIVATARKLDGYTVKEIQNEPNVRDYFTKPIKQKQFLGKIHSLLNTRSPEGPSSPGFGQMKSSW